MRGGRFSLVWSLRENQNGSNELYHYGVKGMRWGVRKNPDKAYSKASNKLRKLDAKLNKLTNKSVDISPKTAKYEAKKGKTDRKLTKLRSNASTKRYKADTAILFQNTKEKSARKAERKLARYEHKAAKMDAKFARQNYKSLKNDAQIKKAQKKAMNWYNSMEKTFSNVSVSNMDPADVALGKQYASIFQQMKGQ